MNIAIIGTGNVGGALATAWAKAGHNIFLGVQNKEQFKGMDLLSNLHTTAVSVPEAINQAEIVLIATPPTAIFDIIGQAGDLQGKICIDATNAVRQKPDPYAIVYHCLADKTAAEVVKCFNSTGFENMQNPHYGSFSLDMFMAGDSDKAKQVAAALAKDAGFEQCYDFGKGDKVELLECFALSWINLAIMQGYGRSIGFKVVKR